MPESRGEYLDRCGGLALLISEDLAGFEEWRTWDPRTMASYATTLRAKYERLVREARDHDTIDEDDVPRAVSRRHAFDCGALDGDRCGCGAYQST